MWCWRRVEGVSYRRMKDEVVHRIKEKRNILPTIKGRKANWIGHILRSNCLL